MRDLRGLEMANFNPEMPARVAGVAQLRNLADNLDNLRPFIDRKIFRPYLIQSRIELSALPFVPSCGKFLFAVVKNLRGIFYTGYLRFSYPFRSIPILYHVG